MQKENVHPWVLYAGLSSQASPATGCTRRGRSRNLAWGSSSAVEIAKTIYDTLSSPQERCVSWPVCHSLSLGSGLSSHHFVAQAEFLPDYNTKPVSQVRDTIKAQ